MRRKVRQDRPLLLATAKAVAAQLRLRSEGTSIRIRMPWRTVEQNTGGWSAGIGNLGANRPRLELWFDRFTGYRERKLYAGFVSGNRQSVTAIKKRVSRKLWPVRTVTSDDLVGDDILKLSRRLKQQEFNRPVLEKYEKARAFFGFYDPTKRTAERINWHFVARAVAFYEDVARTFPMAKVADEERDVYPRYENRKRVASHLVRERSRLLAAECKIRAKYVCQVCGMTFKKAYGDVGREFAEAHHRVPLHQLKQRVKTRLEDLITVCANCHRMLHQMSGGRDDVAVLRKIVRRRRGR